jgi:hypothetical protein
MRTYGVLGPFGSMLVTERGMRSYGLDGIILSERPDPSGPLAATEVTDTAAFTGTFTVFGTLAVTESPDTAAFSLKVATHWTPEPTPTNTWTPA